MENVLKLVKDLVVVPLLITIACIIIMFAIYDFVGIVDSVELLKRIINYIIS